MQKRRFRSVLGVLVLSAVLVPLNASVAATGQSRAPQWRTILNEGFEVPTFPYGKWITYDGSHTGTQGIWSKAAEGFNSDFGAHPRGGVTPYNYNTHTFMRYGPFSLGGAATDARMLFRYWMETEAGYDFFSWEYSCSGIEEWTGRMVSGNGPGPAPAWASQNFSLKPCVGATKVYVQFTFRSDASVNYQGVWVDNIRIQKFA